MPSCTGATINSAFSGDIRKGRVPSATSPAVLSPTGEIDAV